jgi:hypothetical protein
MAHAQRARQFVEGDDRRVPPAAFQAAEILLAEAAALGKLLLRQSRLLPEPRGA